MELFRVQASAELEQHLPRFCSILTLEFIFFQ
jgi:hypothetical protein